MVKIESLLKEMPYDGTCGNLGSLLLELKTIDVQANKLYFCIAHDYSMKISYSKEDIQKFIPEKNGLEAITGTTDYTVCSLEVSREKLEEMITQIIVFSFLKELKELPKSYYYKNITFEYNGRKSNIGSCCYTLTYKLGRFFIPISVTLRIKNSSGFGNINDLEHGIRDNFFKYAKELGIKETVSSEIMKELGIIQGDNKNLCECFDYDVVDKETVIMHLKDSINPKHLLRFKGFNDGYTDFKIWTNGHNGTLTLIKGDNYFTITWGTSTTCCSDYYWDILDALLECVRIRELMF